MNTTAMNEMEGLVRTACAMESRQRRVVMEPGDRRLPELAAGLIFLAGEDFEMPQQPD